MSIENGKLKITKWVSPWYVDQLDSNMLAVYQQHISKWEGSPDPWPAFYTDYDVNASRQQCVDTIVKHWDNFEDVFTFPTTPIFRIGHPLKRLTYELNITPQELINIEYLVIPSGMKVNPKNGALVLASSLNSTKCSYDNSVALGTKHIKFYDGRIYNSQPGDYITTVDRFELAVKEYPTAPGQII